MTVVTLSDERTATAPRPHSTRPVLLATAALVLANLTVLFIGLLAVLAYYDRHDTTDYLVPQDAWEPFTLLVLGLALVNGLVLVAGKRSRAIGLGVLLGTAVAVVALFGWLALVVGPALA
jgi:hypothetical protein